MRGWSFPSEWLSSTHRSNTMIPDDMVPTAALNPIISLPLVQDIWIHRWIDDDNLKAQLIDIRNILAERTEVEYYTDGSLIPSIPTSVGKQNPNLVYTNMGAAFCVNNEPALSAQTNLSLWPSSTRAELVAIFLALLTGPMNAKIRIYTDSQSAIYMINNQHNKSGRKLLKQTNSLILLKIDILLQEKKMDLELVKVKGHSGDVMNEMVDELAKTTSNNSCYFNNRCNANKEENRYHFIECDANKDLWPIIKSRMQDDVIPIIQKWSNIPENTPKAISEKLNQILGLQHDNKKFIDFSSLALEAKINTNISKISKQTFGFSESKNILFLASLLDSFIIHFKELIWIPRCNATIAWEKTRNIGRKEKLNESENMDRYFKSSHQQVKHLKQDKQTLKKNNYSDLQEDQIAVLDNISIELDSVQSENSLNENHIISKCYRVGKKI
ncbi:ribonuclease H-like domain-containing protein [Rhizophagus irregularis DAOM 181602=DAOM 197198]|nr:ribonuclease H-like domain-containing protein [Rhizophagus irregularis DAOM 181602=DAOM 197198]